MWEKACRSDELALGGARRFAGAENEVGLFRTEAGLFAIENACPHYDADLHEGEVVAGKIHCPWHGWRFQLANGHCDLGSRFDLPVFPVKEEHGHIWVDTAAGRVIERSDGDDEEGFYF